MARLTEELHKEGLNKPDNHDGVISHLEPDILECEVKQALESIIRYMAYNFIFVMSSVFASV